MAKRKAAERALVSKHAERHLVSSLAREAAGGCNPLVRILPTLASAAVYPSAGFDSVRTPRTHQMRNTRSQLRRFEIDPPIMLPSHLGRHGAGRPALAVDAKNSDRGELGVGRGIHNSISTLARRGSRGVVPTNLHCVMRPPSGRARPTSGASAGGARLLRILTSPMGRPLGAGVELSRESGCMDA